jgi:hypothetical protein
MERSFSITQMAMNLGKRVANEPVTGATPELVQSNSNQDIFTSANSEHAKYMIMNGVRHEINRSHSRAISESSSDDYVINKIDPVDITVKPTVVKIDKNIRKPTMLLAGPKFRYHTTELEYNLKRDTIYPISV